MSVVSRIYERIKQRVETLVPTVGLKGKVFRGGAWLVTGSFAEHSFRFGKNILLTRVLAPEAFGLMATVLSATTLIQLLADVGAREALIQSPRGREDGHIGATWWLTLGRAVSIYAVIYALAPFIARFYGHPEMTALTRVATLSVIFDGLMSPRAIVAMKELRFSKVAAIDNGGSILGVIITIILSFFLRDVWALVIGFCSENIIRCILSYVLCPHWPRIPSSLAPFRDLLRFSVGMAGLPFLTLIFSRMDVFVLAKLYSQADLGLYAMAVYLVQTPASVIARIISQTIFPTFSHIQDDPARANRILLQLTSVTALFGLPALVFLAFGAHSLLTVVYGQRYSAADIPLIMAAFTALLTILNSQLTTVFYAKGLPQLHRRSAAVMALFVIVLTYPLAKAFGLWGAQLACLIAVIAGYILQIERIVKVSHLDLSEYRKCFVLPVATSLCAVLACLAARSIDMLSRPLPNIMFGVLCCLVASGVGFAIFIRDKKTDVQSKTAIYHAYDEQA